MEEYHGTKMTNQELLYLANLDRYLQGARNMISSVFGRLRAEADLEDERHEQLIKETEEENTHRVCTISQTNDYEGGETVQKQPVIQYSDGTFRTVRKSGMMQYRFMYNHVQVCVCGYTKEECWYKRYYYDPKKKQERPVAKPKRQATVPAARTPLIKEILSDEKRLRSYSKKAREYFHSDIVTVESVTSETRYHDWAARWLLSKLPQIEPEYFSSIVAYLENDVYPKWGHVKLKDFHMLELQDFINVINGPNKRSKIAAILSESLRFAKVSRVLEYNPYEGVAYIRGHQTPKGALTHKDQLLICCHIRPHKLFAFAMLLLLTGMRPGEVLALEASDFDFDKKEISVTRSFSRSRKESKAPKTYAGYRRIPFEDFLIEFVGPFLDAPGRIFAEFENDGISSYFSDCFKTAGIAGTAYIFRHTFITNAYEIGVPAYVVQRWAGHSKQEQDDAYLALRDSREFVETPFVKYMRLLKSRVVPPEGPKGLNVS